MANTSASDRKAEHIRLAEKAEAVAQKHRANASLWRAKGKTDKADGADAAARSQDSIASNHRREADRLDLVQRREEGRAQAGAAREASIRKAQEAAERRAADNPIDPLQIYTEAMRHADELTQEGLRIAGNVRRFLRLGAAQDAAKAQRAAEERGRLARQWREEADRAIASSGRDLAREHRLAQQAQERRQKQDEKQARRRAEMGVEEDLRTAGAQRDFVSGGKGRQQVASLREYEGMIRKPSERTQHRLEAMRDFDVLCSTAEAGLFPSPDLDRESSSGYGPGALIVAKRAAGLEGMDRLRVAIGGANVEMLKRWIWERHTLTQLVRDGFGTRDTISALCLAAVDAAGHHFRTGSMTAAQEIAAGLVAAE